MNEVPALLERSTAAGVALTKVGPASLAVGGLVATALSALNWHLEALVSSELRVDSLNKVSAPLVLSAGCHVHRALAVWSVVPSAINGLRARVGMALLITIRVRATHTSTHGLGGDGVHLAHLVRVGLGIVHASTEVREGAFAVLHLLLATFLRALNEWSR